jgi:hypothetical protein
MLWSGSGSCATFVVERTPGWRTISFSMGYAGASTTERTMIEASVANLAFRRVLEDGSGNCV